jgi:hypothetical protein
MGGVLQVIAMLVFGASLVSAVACAVTRRLDVARFRCAAGFVSLVVGTIGFVTGAVWTWRVMSESGLTQSDRQRMFSNFLAESIYNGAFIAIAAGPALVVSWWVRRRRRRAC